VEADEDRRRRIVTSDTRWRLIFATLAVVIPLALFALFRRQELRLRALSDHGRPTTAVISQITQRDGVVYAHYRYTVLDASYTWSVSRKDAPHALGQPFAITYLPEDPSLSRPGASYPQERLDAELDLPFQRKLLVGLFAFFAGAAGLCHRQLRRLQKGEPLRTKPLLSPASAGRLVAILLLAVLIATNLDANVSAVQVALFGQRPLGLPVIVPVSLAEAALFAPFFWVFPHLMGIVMNAQAQGASISKLGIVVAIANAGPDLRRSRAVVLAGLIYFVLLVGAWIAFADSRGV
jgi:hypothetical protein